MKTKLNPKTGLSFPMTDRLGNKKIEIAPSSKIEKYLGTMGSEGFFKVILRQNEYDCLVTDESTLTDFGEDEKVYIERIKRLYKVDVSKIKPLYIWKVFKKLADYARHRL